MPKTTVRELEKKKRLIFCAVGSNTYPINLRGKDTRFWDLLDKHPPGWLLSVTAMPNGINGLPPIREMLIIDCGAWAYKEDKESPLTAESVISDYYKIDLPEGTVVIAPDHMLTSNLSEGDLELRRKFNKRQADRFLEICPSKFKPMAVIHGNTLDERLQNANALRDMGYEYLAIGGVASAVSASGGKGIFDTIISMVSAIRKEVPEVWLHVLGLGAVSFIRQWVKLGIDSVDSTHFYQRALARVVWMPSSDGKRIVAYSSYKTVTLPSGKTINKLLRVPDCSCKTCTTLLKAGIDPRKFGTANHFVARVIHNLGVYTHVFENITKPTLVLVSCNGSKQLEGIYSAEDIYRSALFKKSKKWAIANGTQWAILSAKYGVVAPDKKIRNYDLTLSQLDSASKKEWETKVRKQLRQWQGEDIILLAGKEYASWITKDFNVVEPLGGLPIGKQMNWLNESLLNDRAGLSWIKKDELVDEEIDFDATAQA